MSEEPCTPTQPEIPVHGKKQSLTYVLVTPVRNEVATIGAVLDSVLHQTVLPAEWVIVSDESVDGTDDMVREVSRRNGFIRLIRLEKRPRRSFSSVVETIEAGVAALSCVDYDFLGILDGDIRLPHSYYQRILAEFESTHDLGIAGGLVLDPGYSLGELKLKSQSEVAGAVQLFRRECFESLGKLVAMREGGWDAVTCAQARMNGYKTRTLSAICVQHLKPRSSAEGGRLRSKWILGLRDYALGYHPVFEVAKCLNRVCDHPPILGACAHFAAYLWCHLGKKGTMVSPDLRSFVRNEQRRRLMSPFRSCLLRSDYTGKGSHD